MKVMVTGTGRGGTNLTMYFFRHLFDKHFSHAGLAREEDRTVFMPDVINKPLRDKYLWKLVVDNTLFTVDSLDQLISVNPDLKIVFVTRHPCDCLLGKWNRADPDINIADQTPELLIETYQKLIDIHKHCVEEYPESIVTVKMEDILKNPSIVVEKLFSLVNRDYPLDWEKNMNLIPKHYARSNHLIQGYGESLKRDNYDLYKDIANNWGGKFLNNEEAIQMIQSDEIKKLADYFGYEVEL